MRSCRAENQFQPRWWWWWGGRAPSDQQRCYLAAAVCHLIAGMVRRGECPTSCAQLSLLLHSAYPAVPILQLGCLIGDLSQPRETTTSWGVRDPGGAVHDRAAGSNRKGRRYSRQRAEAAEAWRGGSWERGQSLAISRSSRYPSSNPCRCHLPTARRGWGLRCGSL